MPLDMTNFKLERKDKIKSNEIRKHKQVKCLIFSPEFGALHIYQLIANCTNCQSNRVEIIRISKAEEYWINIFGIAYP